MPKEGKMFRGVKKGDPVVTLQLDAELAEQVWLALQERVKAVDKLLSRMESMRLPARVLSGAKALRNRLDDGSPKSLVHAVCPQGDIEDEHEAQTAAAV